MFTQTVSLKASRSLTALGERIRLNVSTLLLPFGKVVLQGHTAFSDILLSCLFKDIQKLRTVLKEIVLKIFLRPPER